MAGGQRSRKVIVTADDLGMSSSVNKAVLFAFENNLVTRASIMANMPGFEEACDFAREFQWQGRIGVHLNLCEGRPLTNRIIRCASLCDPAGSFRAKRRVFHLSREERQAIEEEFEAQIEACRARGIQPTHLDSHRHYHTEWPIGAITIRVALRNGIRAVRLSRNCGPRLDPVKRLYKALFNARLRLHGLATTRYFGSLEDTRGIIGSTQTGVEVMVHPRMNAHGMVTDMSDGEQLESLLDRFGVLASVALPHRVCTFPA